MSRIAAALAWALLCAGNAFAQSYPSAPVKLVVGFPPGGANDILGRLVGAKLTEAWGQPVLVENKPGANAIIATEFVAKSAPDGYTLLVGASGAMTFNPGLYQKLNYDPVRDFAPVTLLGSFPLVLAVNPSVPAQTVKELIAHARDAGGKLNYAAGSTPFQLAAELFKIQAGIAITHIPYKGSAAAVSSVMANDTQLTFVDAPPVVGQIRGGKLRGLAVTSGKRSSLVPELPAIAEEMPGYEIIAWFGLVAPAKLPEAVVQRLNDANMKAMAGADFKQRFATIGADVAPMGPAEFGRFIQSEVAHWAKLVKLAGIEPE